MKTTLLILYLCYSILVCAQPTLSTAITPVIGQNVSFILHDTTGIFQGPSGASQNWTYTLSTGSTQSYTYVASAGTPYANQFNFATIPVAYNDGNGTWHYSDPNSNYHDYFGYKNANDELIYSDPENVLTAPFTYAQLAQDIVSANFTIAGVSGTRTGTSDIYYDAYGTLNLNGTTYNNVARLFHEENFNDITSTDTIVSHIENFYWYDANTMQRVFEINVTYINNAIVAKSVKSYMLSTGIQEPLSNELLHIIPSVAYNQDVQCFTTKSAVKGAVLAVFSADGKKTIEIALSDNLSNYTIPSSQLKKGVYFVQLSNQQNNTVTIQKLVVL
jgi:hypothetical protein